MKDLLMIHHTWKYAINIPSTEFPIKSNQQIIQFLKILNGSNAIGFSRSKEFLSRYDLAMLYLINHSLTHY